MAAALSVFGLGYVGCVSAACFAKEGHDVIGVDLSSNKVDMINRGQSTIVEAGIGPLVAEMVKTGRLRATTDAEAAVAASSISLVCVGTPTRANGSIDLAAIERVCTDIGGHLRHKAERHTVVIRSTVLPGTIHELAIPALERASAKQAGSGFGICSNPEFLREGTSIADFYDPPYTLIGADDAESSEAIAGLYAGISAPVHVVPIRVAETVKYASNCFHGLKIGFANEIGNLCKSLGVDSHEVMRLFAEDRKLNISASYLRPGFAFGGSCLPKDLRALTYRAKELDIHVPILNAILESNEKQVRRAFDLIMAIGSKRIGVLGLSFKEGTDDLRESPMVSLIEMLIGKGMQLSIYDGNVSQSNLMGSNREYIEHEIPHIWSLMKPSIADVLRDADIIVLGNRTKEFGHIDNDLGEGQVVVDLVRLFGSRVSDDSYIGICW
jgi:GDP-mannose 6-dehydrogenase